VERNALTRHLFGAALDPAAEISAVDRWSVHVLGSLFDSVTHNDVREKDLGGLGEVLLSLEYDVTG
jgi:hypothetical protein